MNALEKKTIDFAFRDGEIPYFCRKFFYWGSLSQVTTVFCNGR